MLVVDETRASAGVGEGVVTALAEADFSGPVRRVAAHDTFVPLGDAANLVLVGEADIVAAARALSERPAQPTLPWEPPTGPARSVGSDPYGSASSPPSFMSR